jgi:hypothetical protein
MSGFIEGVDRDGPATEFRDVRGHPTSARGKDRGRNFHLPSKNNTLSKLNGGDEGIRTLETVSRLRP